MELSEFNSDYLANLLEKLSVENKTLVLLGDFNADLLKYHTNSDISNFLDSMYSSLLLPHIAGPTRTTATSATIIDNIFSDNCNSPYTSGNLVITLSDHHAQFLILGNQHNSIENNKEEQLYRDFQEIEKRKDTISEQLENIYWEAELRLERNNVNLSSELLIIKVNKLINFWAPLQKVSNKRKKALNKPWMTKAILKLIAIKNRLHKKMCRSKDPLNKKELEAKVKNYKKVLLKLTRSSKANHFNNFFRENKLNLFKTWEAIREIINISKKRTTDITSLQIGNKTVKNSYEIASEFNKHFTSIGKQIEEKLKNQNKYSEYLKNPNANSFFISPTNSDEVLSVIKELKNNKSTGPSSIHSKLLKLFQTALSKPISLIANLSFSSGTFPDNLKIANVIPIFKKDDPTICNNYRPISLLPNISKIIEKLIHTRLTVFFKKSNILYERQFGFRPNHSTTHALLEITEKIKQACDSGKYACGVFLDLQKAFDTVNHDILLKKLNHYGIRGIANNWFCSFLSGRMQFTSINKSQSVKRELKYGVPQGSVLGPLLFILFINHLHKNVEFSTVHHFAQTILICSLLKNLSKS